MAEETKNREQGTTKEMAKTKSETAKREEEILRFWQENKIFEQSLAKPSPQGEFVFYDGPPFATGLPHYGSLLSSIIKDVIPRYKTMRGFHVRRRWGWDCHGLPIENMVEKQLQLKTKKDIETLGVETFNRACRDSVLRYTREWKDVIDRVGRWVEFDNAYKTMDATYMESVWWALKQLYDKGLLYEGRKVLPYCPRCETPLAKAEIAMDHSYVDVTEEAVTVKFKVKNPDKLALAGDVSGNIFLLAWTTTPWTLPGNVALAVNPEEEYLIAELKEKKDVHFNLEVGERVIFMGTSQISKLIFGDDFREDGGSPKEADGFLGSQEAVNYFGQGNLIFDVVPRRGSRLVGLEYESLFDIPAVKATGKKAWYVAPADFVSTEEGTGIVHTAVIYGEDDYELGLKLDLPAVPLLDQSGHFNADAPELIRGEYFKKAEKAIKDDLERRGLLFSRAIFTHSYPHCHRCNTLLYYNAISSWFVNIQKIKERMVALNEEVNWFPEHLKHGRFLNTLQSAPDWTISRNRYWASPLPIWKCSACAAVTLIGSVDELKAHTKKSGNRYLIMRHGEAENNVLGVISSKPDNPHHLTEKGKEQVALSTEQLKKEKIDLVITSPFVRARETAEIVAGVLGLSRENVLVDERIREVKAGEFDGKTIEEFHTYFAGPAEYFTTAVPGGENYTDIKKRMGAFLYDLEERYSAKTILVITHDSPAWLLSAAAEGRDMMRAEAVLKRRDLFIGNAEVKELPFIPLPHDETYTLDLHRPYIDALALVCSCGKEMRRIPEVVDGWVESGSMPFAEYHYPFENSETFTKRFPGDFIAEYIAQTRTWFYYMHTLAVALFSKPSFKNVVTTGNILGDDGNKMSKSRGNYTDPQINIDQYGADALRYYLMTSVVMQAEDVRFADEDLREVHNQAVNILRNVLQFYRTYKNSDSDRAVPGVSTHPLDVWILTRLSDLVREVTEHMEAYNTVRAGRPIRTFITDFSTWYIRRSRERFKSEDKEDAGHAFATTRFVLAVLAKIVAPFMPYLAEEIYQEVKKDGDPESVHLAEWPQLEIGSWKLEVGILEEMEEARRVVSLGLEARARAGIKVRQPLQKLKIKNEKLKTEEGKELLQLIKDEVNVKEIVFDVSVTEEVELDTLITDELREEGMMRDFIRAIQDLRKKSGWTPSDRGVLTVHTDAMMLGLIKNNEDHIRRSALLDAIKRADAPAGEKIVLGESAVIAALQKS